MTFPVWLPIDNIENHQRWATNIRDPAKIRSEGVRVIQTTGAECEYEIAMLDETRWAICMSCFYTCGDYAGRGLPWTAFPSRQHSIDYFLEISRRHFSVRCVSMPMSQCEAGGRMLEKLADGLFGFIEPDVVQ